MLVIMWLRFSGTGPAYGGAGVGRVPSGDGSDYGQPGQGNAPKGEGVTHGADLLFPVL